MAIQLFFSHRSEQRAYNKAILTGMRICSMLTYDKYSSVVYLVVSCF